jgi:hypothetical protein
MVYSALHVEGNALTPEGRYVDGRHLSRPRRPEDHVSELLTVTTRLVPELGHLPVEEFLPDRFPKERAE